MNDNSNSNENINDYNVMMVKIKVMGIVTKIIETRMTIMIIFVLIKTLMMMIIKMIMIMKMMVKIMQMKTDTKITIILIDICDYISDRSSYRVNLTAKGGDDKQTPLHDAVVQNQLETARLLLEYGGVCFFCLHGLYSSYCCHLLSLLLFNCIRVDKSGKE